MFCPQAVDYGNVADWFSGVGSVAAVAVALWIAIRDRRIRRAEDKARMVREAEDENSLIVEALALYRSLKSMLSDVIDAIDGSGHAVNWYETEKEVFLVRETARRLQQLPSVTIRMYKTFERIINLTHIVDRVSFEDDRLSEMLMKLRGTKQTIEFDYVRLMRNPNPLAPLNW